MKTLQAGTVLAAILALCVSSGMGCAKAPEAGLSLQDARARMVQEAESKKVLASSESEIDGATAKRIVDLYQAGDRTGGDATKTSGSLVETFSTGE